MRAPLEAVDQNRWRFEREAAWMKPLCGGDRVDLLGGRLFIDGSPLALSETFDIERFGKREIHLNLDAGGGPDIRSLMIPDGEVLLLGDHRGASRDSRWFGTVPVEALYGRAVGVFWRGGEGPTWRVL